MGSEVFFNATIMTIDEHNVVSSKGCRIFGSQGQWTCFINIADAEVMVAPQKDLYRFDGSTKFLLREHNATLLLLQPTQQYCSPTPSTLFSSLLSSFLSFLDRGIIKSR